jgi:hypothetical protein
LEPKKISLGNRYPHIFGPSECINSIDADSYFVAQYLDDWVEREEDNSLRSNHAFIKTYFQNRNNPIQSPKEKKC